MHGDEPDLFANLMSFCVQDYPAPAQVLFGAQDAQDPAIAVAQSVIAAAKARPGQAPRDYRVIVDGDEYGSNRKVSNLINMARSIDGEIVVLADSDIGVEPDYLRRLAAALAAPGVGLVTCLYRGRPNGGLWARLCAMGVDYAFLPNAFFAAALKLAHPCFGATIALRKSTLDEIGGFQLAADRLADDYALGEAVRKTGRTVAVADFAVAHGGAEASFEALWRQEIRWARTIKAIDPLGYGGSLLTHAFALAALALILSGFDRSGWFVLAASMASRALLRSEVDRAFPGEPGPLWLLPARDLLSFAIFLGSYASANVSWRGRTHRAERIG